ncbi:polyprenyl synthetase family protein [Leadbettera azotonutricia]|uniref:Polyprenyl synthetase family protein n=1 Tax=Leadbettera azotonutricia (strain ATCC BAA-888 / DSM 13862 / ZAS-9) TaxID=545695 RepID=F5YCH1_LEAAZ|nr:polyprenyl synthetase family protein [Leadbettera azotonutricia]AEF82191.1 polyprenyl synthetase family protein [Leadbettera azotonutricia ZAS-9]
MKNEYTARLEKIEAVLRTWLPENPGPSWLEDVFALPGDSVSAGLEKSLSLPGWDLVNRGGKRWRPLLMLLAAECVSGEQGAEAALALTPLVEFPHNASLIHDDIEDNSDERRGKPAVHLIYGSDSAINSGAFLYFLPLSCISAWHASAEAKNRVCQIWGEYMRRLHLGQAMDIAWHRDYGSLPGLDEYDRMCRLKTGCLARLAAVLGIHCGFFGAAQYDDPKALALANAFGEAAEKLGVGFQILDDVKNLTTGIPGKKRGDDVVEGKKSLPVLLYLHRNPAKKEFASRCFAAARKGGAGVPEVEEFIAALDVAGVLEDANQRGLRLIGESRKVFTGAEAAGFPLKKEGRELMAGLVDLIS